VEVAIRGDECVGIEKNAEGMQNIGEFLIVCYIFKPCLESA